MKLFKSLLNISSSKKNINVHELRSGQFDELVMSLNTINFKARHEKILHFEGELVSVASMGNHDKLVKLLESLLAEINMCNSNVSRYVATPIKNHFPTSNKAAHVQSLYLAHNRSYIEIRKLCKDLIYCSPLLAGGENTDDIQMLDESQSEEVFASLMKISDAIQSLEGIWALLEPFEQESHFLRKQSRRESVT